MMRARGLRSMGLAVRTLAGAAMAALALAACAAAPAGAHFARAVSSFTASGTQAPYGVAVDQATDDVYVAGGASGNVVRYSASGARDTSFVSPKLKRPFAVAVDNSKGSSAGDVYVTVSETDVVKLDSAGGEVAGFTPITAASIPAGDPGSTAFAAVGVAVDPENGDVLVNDLDNGEVDIFSSAGAFVSQFAAPGAFGVAAGAGGEVFTAGEESGSQAWSPADGYTTPLTIDHGEAHAIAVDLASGHVFADGGGHVAEDEASGAPVLQFGAGLLEGSLGLAVDEKTDTVYASEEAGDRVYVFGPLLHLADATTGTASPIATTSASVSGTVEPQGTSVTDCRFEYGLSASYGLSRPCSQAPPLTGNAPIAVSGSLAGLQPSATYHYRLAVSNADGASYGEDETFQMPPAAPSLDGQSVSGLTQTTAILNARIDPNNQSTTYHFEYGASAAYGTVLPGVDADIGSGYGDVSVGQEITGLTPNTTYHFRVVARNATSPAGGSAGADQTFTTPPVQPPIVSTGPAQGVAQNMATLTATVDTQGYETTYELDFGADTSYGIRIFGDAGSAPGTQTFTATLPDLAPGTAYHYRIGATNAFGTVYGLDQTFTTASYPTAELAEPALVPLVPAILLAPAPSTGPAKAVSVRLVAHIARRGKAGRSRGRRGRKVKLAGTGHARGTNRERGR